MAQNNFQKPKHNFVYNINNNICKLVAHKQMEKSRLDKKNKKKCKKILKNYSHNKINLI